MKAGNYIFVDSYGGEHLFHVFDDPFPQGGVMPGTIGDRWEQTGVSSAGDRVFSRKIGGGGNVDYSDWTKDDLSSELESRGLAKSGNKDELIARLQEDDAA